MRQESAIQNVTHFNHYVHMGGSWGAKQSLGDSDDISPKYQALRDWVQKTDLRK